MFAIWFSENCTPDANEKVAEKATIYGKRKF